MTMNRIWFVSEPFYPENEGVGYYMNEYAFHLAKRYDCGAFCTFPSYSNKGSRCAASEVHENVEIFRTWTPGFSRHKLLFRLINTAVICFIMFFRMMWRVRKGDILVVSTAPPFLVFLVIFVCFFKRARSIVHFFDLYPDMAVVAGVLKKNALITKIIFRISYLFYDRADVIITVARDMQNLLEAKMKGFKGKIVCNPLFVETDSILPQPKAQNPFVQELHLEDKFVVLIAGNLGVLHDVNLFLDVARKLKPHSDIVFLVFASGKKVADIEKGIRNGLDNIVIHPRVPREQTDHIVNSCDLAISSLFIDGMYGMASPTRAYAIMSAGKPQLAITDDDTEVDLLIKEGNAGWQVRPGDVDGAVQAIRDAYDRRDKLAEMQTSIRETAVRRCDKKIALEIMDDVIGSMIGDSRSFDRVLLSK